MRYKVEAVVEVDGSEETFVAEVDGRDVRTWEARHAESFMAQRLSYTQLTELAFFALARVEKYSGGYDAWMADCIGVREISETQEVEAESRPTKKGRGGGSRQR